MTKRFEVGRTFEDGAPFRDAIYSFESLPRTAQLLTTIVLRAGSPQIYVDEGVEQFKRFGNYSMCAVINVDLGVVLKNRPSLGRSMQLR